MSADEEFCIRSFHLLTIRFARCTEHAVQGLWDSLRLKCRYAFLLRQMHACSNFSRLDVVLIQPSFIPPGIDVPLHSLKLLYSYKNTCVAHDYKETLSRSTHWELQSSSELGKRKRKRSFLIIFCRMLSVWHSSTSVSIVLAVLQIQQMWRITL